MALGPSSTFKAGGGQWSLHPPALSLDRSLLSPLLPVTTPKAALGLPAESRITSLPQGQLISNHNSPLLWNRTESWVLGTGMWISEGCILPTTPRGSGPSPLLPRGTAETIPRPGWCLVSRDSCSPRARIKSGASLWPAGLGCARTELHSGKSLKFFIQQNGNVCKDGQSPCTQQYLLKTV